MNPNPALGVLFHWLGGFASASFYVPYRFVKVWSWETYWLAGGLFSWVFAPLIIASLLTNDLFTVLRQTPGSTLFWCYFFGLLWGFGGLTFGLTMRYLGLSLGVAVALGYCAAFGTLVPPIFRGEFESMVLGTTSGIIILIGVVICVAGIGIAGLAGMSKERDLTPDQKTAIITEFNLKKGLLVATFCGIMSACFSYGLAAAGPIRGTDDSARYQRSVAGPSRSCRGSLGRRNDQHRMVFDSKLSQQLLHGVFRTCSSGLPKTAAPGTPKLLVLRSRRHNVVFPIFLLYDGRNANGRLPFLKLDLTHGQHHDLRIPSRSGPE